MRWTLKKGDSSLLFLIEFLAYFCLDPPVPSFLA
jgi:hypothetical protein